MRPPLLPAGCWGACMRDGKSGWPGPDRVRPHPRAYGCRLPGIAGLLRGPALVPLEPDRISGVIAHRPCGKEHCRVACRHRASIGSPHRRGSGRDLILRLVPETTTAPSFVPERLLSGPNRPAATQKEGGDSCSACSSIAGPQASSSSLAARLSRGLFPHHPLSSKRSHDDLATGLQRLHGPECGHPSELEALSSGGHRCSSGPRRARALPSTP